MPGVIAAVSIALSLQAAPPPASLPPHWSASLGAADRAALQAALTKPPKGLAAGDALDDHDEKGRNHPIRTCAQYARALKAGWSAEDNAQIATESFFIRGCTLVEIMLKATPSRVSYVADLRLDASPLDVLPPSIADLVMGDEEGQKKAEEQGKSLRQFDPTLKVVKAEPGQVAIENDDSRYELEIVGYGDFNGDGVEDVLLFQASYATQGTMHIYEPVVLTRTKPGAVLRLVEVK